MLGILENLLATIIVIQLIAWFLHKHFFDNYSNPICIMFMVVYLLRKFVKD